MCDKHGPIVKNLGDVVVLVDHEKHGPLVKNVGEVNVIPVDLQELRSGREKPWGRNTRGLLETWFGREKPPQRRRNTRGFTKNMF